MSEWWPLQSGFMTDDRCPHGHALREAETRVARRHTQPVLFCQTCSTLYYPDGTEVPDLSEIEVAVEQLIAARRRVRTFSTRLTSRPGSWSRLTKILGRPGGQAGCTFDDAVTASCDH